MAKGWTSGKFRSAFSVEDDACARIDRDLKREAAVKAARTTTGVRRIVGRDSAPAPKTEQDSFVPVETTVKTRKIVEPVAVEIKPVEPQVTQVMRRHTDDNMHPHTRTTRGTLQSSTKTRDDDRSRGGARNWRQFA